ncbi:hypothetical protein REPUB_Repub01dG0002000 [Reevesia pubescens]
MASTAACGILLSLSFPKHNYKPITSHLPFSNSFTPISSLKLAHPTVAPPKRAYRVLASHSTPDPHQNPSSPNADQGA